MRVVVLTTGGEYGRWVVDGLAEREVPPEAVVLDLYRPRLAVADVHVEDEVEIVIQVNGKVRDRMKMSIQASEDEIKNAALVLPKIQEMPANRYISRISAGEGGK